MADATTALTDHAPDFDLPTALAVAGGAVVGGLAGFLFLTRAGHTVRHDVANAAEALFDGLETLLATWDRVKQRPDRSGRSAPPALHRPRAASGNE